MKKLCNSHFINFLTIQETKTTHVDLWMLRQIWGNTFFDFVSSSARGKSGGILCMWNKLLFQKTKAVCFRNYVVVEGVWLASNVPVMFISVYAPQVSAEKRELWRALDVLIYSWDGPAVVICDFNEVWDDSERFGSEFFQNQADSFNEFILDAELIDVSMGGFSFTWTNRWASKMSRLDRFLVTGAFLEVFNRITGLVLEKDIPDHRPIVLKHKHFDYGPSPFRFFNSWLEVDGFYDLVVHTWKNDGIEHYNGLVKFKNKLKNLKEVIRSWIVKFRFKANEIKVQHQECVQEVDSLIDHGCALKEDVARRIESVKFLKNFDMLEAKDLAQKTKLKWATEGDENTKYFYEILKKKRRNMAVKGVMCEGCWIDDPVEVKAEFYKHFKNRFASFDGPRSWLGADLINKLSEVDA